MEIELSKSQTGKIIEHPEFYTTVTKKFTKKAVRVYPDPAIRHLYAQYEKIGNYYGSSKVTLNFTSFADATLKIIKDQILTGDEDKGVRFSLNEWFRIKANPDKIKFHNPKGFRTAFEAIMAKTENRLLFRRDIDGHIVPYLFVKTTYNKAHREDGSVIYASCTITLKYMMIDDDKPKDTKLTYYSDSIKKKTVLQLLNERGYYVESPEMYDSYIKDRNIFDKYVGDIGKQFTASGHCMKVDLKSEYYYWWSSTNDWYKLVTDGTEPNVIVDNPESESEKAIKTQTGDSWWSSYNDDEDEEEVVEETKGEEDDDNEEDDDDDDIKKKKPTEKKPVIKKYSYAVPYHPYLICYNTLTDVHVKIHIGNLKEYKYNRSLRDKLILPQDDGELLDLLCTFTEDLSEDIISGKSGGIIVLNTGIAGTGKTLTAEVFSEFMGRPLYKIQSSQLGVDVKDLDKKLRTILQRAIRWNAILLIDEADVYIRSRGKDIQQNAIVGVFLRLLEYFSGILFMTSNLDDIDDAIVSRATAHINYDYPTKDNLRKIWKILTTQFGVDISEEVIDDFCNKMDNKMTGRDVKNISKLAKIYTTKSTAVDVETLLKISKFKDIKLKGG